MGYDIKTKLKSNSKDVGDFHTKFGLPSTDEEGVYPRELDSEALEFRLKFLIEEVLEFAEAAGYKVFVDNVHLFSTEEVNHEVEITRIRDQRDHAGMFDALIDEVYVAMGTAHLLGYPWERGWDLVQQANMAKVRAKSDGSDSARGSSLDVVKPKGWKPPNIAGLLEHFGWKVSQ